MNASEYILHFRRNSSALGHEIQVRFLATKATILGIVIIISIYPYNLDFTSFTAILVEYFLS